VRQAGLRAPLSGPCRWSGPIRRQSEAATAAFGDATPSSGCKVIRCHDPGRPPPGDAGQRAAADFARNTISMARRATLARPDKTLKQPMASRRGGIEQTDEPEQNEDSRSRVGSDSQISTAARWLAANDGGRASDRPPVRRAQLNVETGLSSTSNDALPPKQTSNSAEETYDRSPGRGSGKPSK